MASQAGNLKKGEFIKYQGDIWQIQKTEFYSPGKGSALMRTKLKNVTSGKTIDFNFKSNESVETIDVSSIEMQYLYKDNENAYFMDNQTYQQYEVSRSVIGNVIKYGDATLNIRPPASVTLKIVQTEDAAKGDTVSGAKKEAELETGAKVMVPLFIKKGETIIVNPETGQYTGRA